jgi:hypothetical protein
VGGGGGCCTFASASRTKKKCQSKKRIAGQETKLNSEVEENIPAGPWLNKKSNRSAISLSSSEPARNQETKLSTHRNSRKKRGYQEKEERALAPTSTADMVADWERRVVLVVRVRQVRPVAEGVCKKSKEQQS